MPSRLRLATLPPHAERLRAEVKAFLQSALEPAPAHVRARSWMGFDAGFSRRLAARGWVGVTLPAQFGGANLDAFSRYVLVEELLAAGAPVSAHWIADRQSGPLILKFGTAAQQAFYLPRICRAEAFFCIGMSEPNSGSDLASVSTRARPAQSAWVLNGQKIWTTNAHRCQYMIALVRSSGDTADRQAGLSQFIVDLSLPGVTVRPIRDLAGDAHFSEVFFDNVRLAPDALLGSEGSGWAQVNAERAFERSGPERIYSSIALLELWITTLRAQGDKQKHAATVGRLVAHLATLRSFDMALEHCNTRVQLGRSIGKFQAIQQQLSLMAEHVAAGAIAAESAFQSAGSAPTLLAAAIAKSRTSEAAGLVAATTHAMHGAIGMTDEYDLGLLTCRLHEWRLDYGAEQHWNQTIGAQLLACASGVVDFVRTV